MYTLYIYPNRSFITFHLKMQSNNKRDVYLADWGATHKFPTNGDEKSTTHLVGRQIERKKKKNREKVHCENYE